MQKAGRIVREDMSQARPVVIRDISTQGAALTVGEWASLPDRFLLQIRPSPGEPAQTLRCVVRWRVGPVTGVIFEEPVCEDVLQALL